MWAYGRTTKVRADGRRGLFGSRAGMPVCPLCGEPFEACLCVCPYCGDRNGCRCCIGYGLATGGD